uniref:MARVEL domain-containing protein n=1 Tax=Panagrellus redivivus TaxID=6233 RepID=A0A7E4W2K6_PANRE
MAGVYNAGYVPSGYESGAGGGGGGYATDNYGPHYYGGAGHEGYGGGGYRGFPQPQPSPQAQPYRRSRTAPARTLPRQPMHPSTNPNYVRYRNRGVSADPIDYRSYRSFSGPAKRPTPMYKKRRPPPRQSNYQETEFVERPSYYYGGAASTGAPIDQPVSFVPGQPGPPPPPPPPQSASAHTLRRVRQYYSPSYTTYPPSTMYPMGAAVGPYGMQPMSSYDLKDAQRRYINKKYPIWARVLVKIAQLLLAAAILGLVLGPMHNHSFHVFVIRTQSEWQGCVVGIVAVFGILTFILLVTVFLANRFDPWRKFDTYVSGAGAFLYILVAFLESYYAACYPPNGKYHREVCHRAEWIVACILCYFNIIFYLIDFIFAMRTGVSLL